MEVSKHICFQEEKVPQLERYLRDNNIVYKTGDISTLDIYESNPHWAYIANLVEYNNLFCLSETIFSEDELSSAEWLTVRSQWRFGYPQPENDFEYESYTYTRDNSCRQCGCGLRQIDSFRIKKPPKWGKRCFAELNWVGDELFVSDYAKSMLNIGSISGISFLPVKNKKGIEIFSDISQLVVSVILEEGLVRNRQSIRAIEECSQCGSNKYILSGIGMLAFRRECFINKPDIVKTSEFFGSGHYATHKIIVRQNVYKLIVANRMDRGLVFQPIELV